MPNLITQAEHARRCGVSRKSVTVWKDKGRLVMSGGLVDFDRSYQGEIWHASTSKLRRDLDGLEAAVSAPQADHQPPAHAGAEPRVPVPLKLRRAEILSRLRALDWTKTFDWGEEAMHSRAVDAAALVGLQAVRSDLEDDGHWGGYQLRSVDLVQRFGAGFDSIVAGYGFELDEAEVLWECREVVWHPDHGPADMEDEFEIRLDLLHLIAYPFHVRHSPPDPASATTEPTP